MADRSKANETWFWCSENLPEDPGGKDIGFVWLIEEPDKQPILAHFEDVCEDHYRWTPAKVIQPEAPSSEGRPKVCEGGSCG